MFWALVEPGDGERGFDGETAYCKVIAFYDLHKDPEANE